MSHRGSGRPAPGSSSAELYGSFADRGEPPAGAEGEERSFERFSARVPLIRDFGYRLAAEADSTVELTAPVPPSVLQVDGRVHGGLLATLADTAGAYLLYRSLPAGRTMASIEFKLNFVRPAVAEAGELRARARLVKRGRSVSLCDIEVAQAGELVAKGLFTYLLLPADGPTDGPANS